MRKSPPDPGEMRFLLQVRAPKQERKEPYGEPKASDDPELIAEVRGSVDPIAGRELWQAKQAQASTTHEVWIRWVPGLSPTWWLMHKGTRRLNIETAINHLELDTWWQLLCRERV